MEEFASCLRKQETVLQEFAPCKDPRSRYEKLIALGKQQIPIDPILKTEETRVLGCQSSMHLLTSFEEGKIFFRTESDAIISAGLAILLVRVYSGESPETVLKCPPDYLQKLGIQASLTPSRANGLASIHLRMKQEALHCLMAPALRDD